jgi:hypothetical protein
MSSIAALQAQRNQVLQQIQDLAKDIEGKRQSIADERRRLEAASSPEEVGRIELSIRILEAGIRVAQASIRRLEALLAEIDAEIALLQLPLQSTGVTVQRDSEGRQEASNITNPPDPQIQVGPDGNTQQPRLPSNATRPSTVPTTGTDDAVRKAQDLQSLPATVARSPIPPSSAGPQPGQERGTAARSDDGASNATTQRINAIFGGKPGEIITQPNVLDEYSSYTYNVSIYMLTPGQYQDLVTSKKKNLAGFQLLMRSGGAPTNTTSYTPQTTAVTDPGEIPGVTTFSQATGTGRNQFFPLDYYLDDIRLRSIIQGKGTGGAHNVISMSFKIFEPNGISLIPNLYKAADQIAQLSGSTKKQNYAAQVYLMVIKFYGADPDGNQVAVQGVLRDENGQPTGQPEVIEKFIPFIFTGIKFRVLQKVTEYDCTAVCPQNFVASSRGRGVIPYNVEITSTTLRDLLAGKIGYSNPSQNSNAADGRQVQEGATASGLPREARGIGGSSAADQVTQITRDAVRSEVVAGNSPTQNTAPLKADAAARPTINQGLFEALNKYQTDLKNNGTITYPDEYIIEIDPILAEAKVVPPGEINKMYTSMNTGQTARDKKDPATNRMDTTTKNTSAVAGMSIVQFIDQYTRTSTYVYDQQTVIYDPNTKKTTRRPYIPGQLIAWYHIGLEATPKRDQWDPKRNDYAYRIKYSLTPYQVNDLKSDYFPQGRYQGAQKVYDFWFTGKNSQVINYEQDFNYLYYLTINNPLSTQVTSTTADYNQYQDEIRRFYQPNSDQSSQGIEGKVNEPSANAADYLYSPADQARVKMTIVGDPAWIQQGELWQGVSGVGYGQAFQSDGTISYDNREVLFNVNFNLPTDYDLETGVMDVGANNVGRNVEQNNPGRARQSYTYRAISVDSTFSRGQFTQEIQGVLVLFSLPRNQPAGLSAEANDRPSSAFLAGPDENSAETRRLEAAQNQARFGGTSFADRANRAGTTMANARRAQISGLFGSQNNNPLISDSLGTEGFGSESLGLVDVAPPTSSGLPVGTETVVNSPVTTTPGSAPPITPLTQLTQTQEQYLAVTRQLSDATRRGDQAEVIRLLGIQSDLNTKLTADQFAQPNTRTNQTVKER